MNKILSLLKLTPILTFLICAYSILINSLNCSFEVRILLTFCGVFIFQSLFSMPRKLIEKYDLWETIWIEECRKIEKVSKPKQIYINIGCIVLYLLLYISLGAVSSILIMLLLMYSLYKSEVYTLDLFELLAFDGKANLYKITHKDGWVVYVISNEDITQETIIRPYRITSGRYCEVSLYITHKYY